ncbi:NADAR family protein [Amycolatopsis sp. cg13]|uniref:NADAR family protein n=1 Tax=Amycolatopsis sp. cg13 TaxID=3238807 RepID=UPI003523BAB6
MEENPRDVAELADRMRHGQRVKFLFFWGHRPESDGSAGRGCLSQWWPAPFTLADRTFATAEHYMMWRKALLFGDETTAGKILEARHPRQAKELGRGVVGFDQDQWDVRRGEIVLAGSVAKFGQHPELLRFLLSTRKRVLVEASPLDRVWGIGLTADDPDAENPARWRGLNLLGFALTQARTLLAESAGAAETACATRKTAP